MPYLHILEVLTQAEEADLLSDLLITPEVAKLLRKTKEVLAKERCVRSSNTPPYFKVGRQVLYSRREVLEWLQQGRVDPAKAKK